MFERDTLNPPQVRPNPTDSYNFNNDVCESINSMQYIMNPSVLNNANFAVLGTHGQSPITTDTDISSSWNILGSANASFTITSTSYPSNSLIQSASMYYLHLVVTAFNGGDFYFYQLQNNTVRKYQKNFLTYGIIAKNNQDKAIKIRADVYSYYDATFQMVSGKTIYLEPGINNISSTLKTESLKGKTVGASPYTEFRLSFIDLIDGTADVEFYQVKCEFGKISTLLNQ
jgi:hypothetical protein